MDALNWVWLAEKPRDAPYHLKFFLVRMNKTTAFKYHTLIDRVSTNLQKTVLSLKGVWPESRDLHLHFHAPLTSFMIVV